MKLTVTAVDEPHEIESRLPLTIDLIRQMPGSDRPDYWLGKPAAPIIWSHLGQRRQIDYVVLASRHEGRKIESGARGILAALCYVTDPEMADAAAVDFKLTPYVAIATVDVD